MFGTKKVGNITFSYKTSELFDDAALLSAHMAKNTVIPEGSALDEFVLTNDEKDVFEVCVKQVMPDIYENLMKMSSGIEDAFCVETIANIEKDGLQRTSGVYISFNINDNNAYNENVLALVDATLLSCLKYGALAEFYSVNLNGDLGRIARDKYTASIMQLNQRLFQLKRKSISPQLL